jgi:hypothetical protein
MCTAGGRVFGSVAEALRVANATMDYLNGPDGADLDPAACGTVLRSLAAVQAKFTAAHAAVLAGSTPQTPTTATGTATPPRG